MRLRVVVHAYPLNQSVPPDDPASLPSSFVLGGEGGPGQYIVVTSDKSRIAIARFERLSKIRPELEPSRTEMIVDGELGVHTHTGLFTEESRRDRVDVPVVVERRGRIRPPPSELAKVVLELHLGLEIELSLTLARHGRVLEERVEIVSGHSEERVRERGTGGSEGSGGAR